MITHVKHLACDNCESRNKGIFCELEHIALATVSNTKIMNTFKKGQIIFQQGNPPLGLYCVYRGKIKITRINKDGKESIVRIVSAGDILGHRSLFSNENCTATASALEDATLCFFDKKFILNSIREQPSIALSIIQKLSRDMGSAESKNTALAQKNVRIRLAELLISFSELYGVQENNKIKLDIKLTREEIATMIGTATETVIRTITEFKAEGFIEQDGKTLYVIDKQRLLNFVNLVI